MRWSDNKGDRRQGESLKQKKLNYNSKSRANKIPKEFSFMCFRSKLHLSDLT